MRKILALLPLLVLVVAACGGGSSPSPSSPAATVAPPTSAAPASVPASEAPSPTGTEEPTGTGEATVMVATSPLGQILVDAEGMTLYLFTPDEAGTPTCYDACAEAWPPLLAEGDEIEVGEGLDDSDFSTVARTDDGEQIKIGDWPLYYFAGDEAPGDTNGQGLNGSWFVVGPNGEAIR
jgi:predicted lipoprotein with Yx(FWY)xxD motif